MPNVVQLRTRRSSSEKDATRSVTAESLLPLQAQISEIRNRQAKVKDDIRLTIFMLDLALARAQLVSATTGDAQLKVQVDSYLSSVCELLQIARERASAL